MLRGGVKGNQRLTATSALVLLVLLAAEGATIPFVRQQLTLHIFLGLVLVPPVVLKLASTGWRFARYYLKDAVDVRRGPPRAFLRLLVAPSTVASTLVLFGTGVALVIVHPQRGLIVGLHKASFVVWFGAMSVHVLAHVLKVPRLARADYRGGIRRHVATAVRGQGRSPGGRRGGGNRRPSGSSRLGALGRLAPSRRSLEARPRAASLALLATGCGSHAAARTTSTEARAVVHTVRRHHVSPPSSPAQRLLGLPTRSGRGWCRSTC